MNFSYGALREETVQGRQILVDSEGRCIANVTRRVEAAEIQVAYNDQLRHLQGLGIPTDSLASMPGGRQAIADAASGRSVDQGQGRPECGTRAEHVARLKQVIEEHRKSNGNDARPAFQRNHPPITSVGPGATRPATSTHPRLSLTPDPGEAQNRPAGPKVGE